eukprot:59710-Pleurochrysis_carterae.AAC.1
MAVERQEHRIRRERAAESGAHLDRTKPSSEMNSICRGLSELYRHAPPCPRDGGKWALEVPLQGEPQPQPEPPPSQGACEQRTRGRAGAHAGPEPEPVSGRNRHAQGQSSKVKQHVLASDRLLLSMMFLQLEMHTERYTWQNSTRHEKQKLSWSQVEHMPGRNGCAQVQSRAVQQQTLSLHRLLLPMMSSQLEMHTQKGTGHHITCLEKQKPTRGLALLEPCGNIWKHCAVGAIHQKQDVKAGRATGRMLHLRHCRMTCERSTHKCRSTEQPSCPIAAQADQHESDNDTEVDIESRLLPRCSTTERLLIRHKPHIKSPAETLTLSSRVDCHKHRRILQLSCQKARSSNQCELDADAA